MKDTELLFVLSHCRQAKTSEGGPAVRVHQNMKHGPKSSVCLWRTKQGVEKKASPPLIPHADEI